ncbi:FMRFamide receptor-like [Biomphalaria glabrata]|uniref:FMRFamide receptor-like n=1 Tax=Biomphalaria glabrata TaxID=6526 RepID=A0A9W3B6A0_BIOGL|nr:FMRFamide receptor-like [Biomphalaria glabrata]
MSNGTHITSNQTLKATDDSFDVSDEVYYLLLFVTNAIIANILSLIGILGSILNVIILSHHKMQDTTNVILLAISVCDLIYSITQISFNFYQFARSFINVYIFQWATVINLLIFDRINYIALIVSIHLVTLVSIERMVAVCFPFHVSRVFTLYRMKCIIISIVCCNIVLRIPFYFKFEMYFDEYKNVTMPFLRFGDLFFQNITFFNTYSRISALFLYSILPFFVIFICTFATIFHISITSKTNKALSSMEAIAKRKKEMKSVKIVLIICVFLMFFILIPLFVQQVLFVFALVISQKLSLITFWIVNILVQLNSSFNFVIYVTGSPKFKRTLMKIFYSKRLLKEQS